MLSLDKHSFSYYKKVLIALNFFYIFFIEFSLIWDWASFFF